MPVEGGAPGPQDPAADRPVPAVPLDGGAPPEEPAAAAPGLYGSFGYPLGPPDGYPVTRVPFGEPAPTRAAASGSLRRL